MSKQIIAPRSSVQRPGLAVVSTGPVSVKSPPATSPPILVKLRAPSVDGSSSSSTPGTPRTSIMTSKEWVLPPRPKPGRKPSVDTPASKRKAQNRAAQRAFRERRATRVQELEARLMEVEKERDVKEMGLINTINKLKYENQYLIKHLDQMKSEINNLKKGHYSGNYSNTSPANMGSNSPTNSIYSVQQISPAPSTSADSPPNVQVNFKRNSRTSVSSLKGVKIEEKQNEDFDCGVCLKDDCLCESVGIKEPTMKDNLEEKLSSFKPMQAVQLKRKPANQEVDFTSKFTKKALPEFKKTKKESHIVESSHNAKFDESSPVDNCGFCSDDTPCVCREAAKEAARLNESLNHGHMNNEQDIDDSNDDSDDFDDEQTLPPIQVSSAIRKTSLPVMHPGPSVGIRDITNLTPGAVPTVMTPTIGTPTSSNPTGIPNNNSSSSESGGCTGNPGTCNQCQTDPMSTLFCTTVANKANESNERGGPKSRESSVTALKELPPISSTASPNAIPSTPTDTTNPSTPIPINGESGMFIPCADAYRALSRHKKFRSVDFSQLVGKLTTRGMQVEVQSVANVLRELDRRVYN